jgi:hypothetical protein
MATLRGRPWRWHFSKLHAHAHRLWNSRFAAWRGHDDCRPKLPSLKKGESLLDTVHTLDAMKPDCLVMRHASWARRTSWRSI